MYPPQPPRPEPKWKARHTVLVSILGSVVLLVLAIVILNAAFPTNPSDTEPSATAGDDLPEGFDAYLADLDAIDPGIREGREDRPVFNDASNLCASIADGTDEETLIQGTIARFGVNEAEDVVTEDVAIQILDVTREHCDTIRPE